MSRPSMGTEREVVSFAAVPLGRVWTALCLIVGSVALSLAVGAALGARARATQASLIAEALSSEAP